MLFQRGEHACADSWTAATLFPKWYDKFGAMWHSAKTGGLEMPLQFKPKEIAVPDDETLLRFIAT